MVVEGFGKTCQTGRQLYAKTQVRRLGGAGSELESPTFTCSVDCDLRYVANNGSPFCVVAKTNGIELNLQKQGKGADLCIEAESRVRFHELVSPAAYRQAVRPSRRYQNALLCPLPRFELSNRYFFTHRTFQDDPRI